MIWHRQCTQWM